MGTKPNLKETFVVVSVEKAARAEFDEPEIGDHRQDENDRELSTMVLYAWASGLGLAKEDLHSPVPRESEFADEHGLKVARDDHTHHRDRDQTEVENDIGTVV